MQTSKRAYRITDHRSALENGFARLDRILVGADTTLLSSETCVNENLTIFATMNGVDGVDGVPGVSGGDVRIITILKNWSQRARIILSTSAMGEALGRSYGLQVDYKVIGGPSGSGVFVNVMKVLRSLTAIPRTPVSLSYSGGEHLYDVLVPAILKLFRRVPWIAVVHWVEDYPWHDARGGTPVLHRYLYWLNRVAAMLLIYACADKILAVSESTREKLITRRHIASARVSTVLCGLDLDASLRTRARGLKKKYDAVFMKRLNYGKGVRDLVEIWARVVAERQVARLQIIGDGPHTVVAETIRHIKDLQIQDNVDLIGVVHDQTEKMERLAQSQLFILPSHEENWAIVIGEALAIGLPVIAYDLEEIRPLWGARVAWVPFGDTVAFAQEIIEQLERPRPPALADFLAALDWEAIAEKEYSTLRCVIDHPSGKNPVHEEREQNV